MNIRKIAMGLAVAGVMALATGAAQAQQFSFSTTVNPTVITTTDLTGQLTFTGSAGTQNATAPTSIILTNITETSTNLVPGSKSPIPTTPVTINMVFTSVVPAGGPGTTNVAGSGSITGSFGFDSSLLDYTFNVSSPVVFNFGSAGIYTISNFQFVEPGPESTLPNNIGAIRARVTYTPAVPEPSTYAVFALMGMGLLGLMVRARKVRQNGAMMA